MAGDGTYSTQSQKLLHTSRTTRWRIIDATGALHCTAQHSRAEHIPCAQHYNSPSTDSTLDANWHLQTLQLNTHATSRKQPAAATIIRTVLQVTALRVSRTTYTWGTPTVAYAADLCMHTGVCKAVLLHGPSHPYVTRAVVPHQVLWMASDSSSGWQVLPIDTALLCTPAHQKHTF